MTLIARELDQKLQSVDKDTAQRLERLVRDAMELATGAPADADAGHALRVQRLFAAMDKVEAFSAADRLSREEVHAR